MKLKYEKYWKKGKDFLKVDIPILAGAMTWLSDSKLVKAVSDAGGFGVLAAGNMPVELLEKEIKILREAGAKFAVNLIVIAPNYLEHLKKTVELGVKYIVFAGSFPRKEEVKIAKDGGAKVITFASTESIAQRMIDYGADALILEGSEAGGHIGHVSTIVLLQQVLFSFSDKIPIFIAGGIATGKMIAHLLLMGAAGVQMGTIFAMSEESPAHIKFKERYKRANAREAVSTPRYDSALPVVSVRAIYNKGIKEFGKLQLELLKKLNNKEISRRDAIYEVESFWIGALRKAVQDGDVNYGSLMAGQSVGLINEIKPVGKIIEDLVEEAEKTFDNIFNSNK
jgi:enoyl-[acyl-carrier protein] reductase II